MGRKIPRDPFVRASFERKNNLGKGKAILSEKDRLKQQRHARKHAFLREQKRSGYDDGSFFYCLLYRLPCHFMNSVIISARGFDSIDFETRDDFAA